MTTARRTQLKRELPPAAALAGLLLTVAIAAPSFFAAGNLRDVALNNAATLLVAVGMTLVILGGEIDISVASQFAVCSVAAGMLARSGVPMALLPLAIVALGAALGALNGVLVGVLRLPSIIVTLAMFVAWRDALRWATEGAWVQDLPRDFQWLGLAPAAAQTVIVGVAFAVLALFAWGLARQAPAARCTPSARMRRRRASRGSSRRASCSARSSSWARWWVSRRRSMQCGSRRCRATPASASS
jgi:rhamnose transport system permease protein